MLQIPATILTGFLGAGKTTLLKRLLEEPHGQRLAIIENEFGEENIDKEFLVTRSEEQIYQMSNGCICCSIRQDLREALLLLAEKKKQGELAFDRIVIETTGLADPGPVAQTFFADPAVAGLYLLDSIVTVVDARHAPQQLDKRQEASRQVGFADRLFISKSDLVSAGELRQLQERLGRINRRAPQKLLHHGKLDFAVLPGPTLSEGVEGLLQEQIRRTGKSIEEQGAELVKAMRPSSITQRFQTAGEVANLVLYTCSPLSSATTGAALRADGGVADTPI